MTKEEKEMKLFFQFTSSKDLLKIILTDKKKSRLQSTVWNCDYWVS